MNKRERDEQFSRNFWDEVHADRLMSVIKHCDLGSFRDDLMETHLHLVFHFAHDENNRHDWHVEHGIRSVLQLQNLVTRSSVDA